MRIQRRAAAFERDLTERFGDGIALTGKVLCPPSSVVSEASTVTRQPVAVRSTPIALMSKRS